MPKTMRNAVKGTKNKPKLTPSERSQIAKDRWAKRREGVVEMTAANADKVTVIGVYGDGAVTLKTPPVAPDQPATPPTPAPEQPPVTPESIAPMMSGDPVNLATFRPAPTMNFVPYDPNATAQQLVPVAPKKQKRYIGPKEFSVALKAAESRLAKAIVERAQASGQLAMLQAEIPSLIQIINALKGQQNVPAVPYDLSGAFNPQQAFQAPAPQQYAAPSNPLAAIQAAMATAPVSRASGGAMQFGPDVVGTLEGPEDEDMDKFITGPAAGGGWIGG